MTNIREVDELTKHWLAGFIEAKSCFSTQKRKLISGNYSLHPKIIVETTNYEIAEKLAKLFDVSPIKLKKQKENYKKAWKVVKAGKEAVEWMEFLLPLLSKRKSEKIRSLIESCKTANK